MGDDSIRTVRASRAHAIADEVDLMVLHALQIAPRASWAEIGGAIDMPPTTVARRWARLTGHGVAWVSTYVPTPYSRVALVHVDTDPGRTDEVIAALCAMPGAVTIDEISGEHDLLVTVLADDTGMLAAVLRQIGGVPGVLGSATAVATSMVAHATHWRLDALDPAQAAAMRRIAPSVEVRPAPRIEDIDRELGRALADDGRASATDLARRLSVSVNTVRRRVSRLVESGWLTQRCDLAAAVSGHDTIAYLWFKVAPDKLNDAAAAIAALPERRAVFTVASRHNLFAVVWLHRPEDLPELEARIGRVSAEAVIDDRSIVLRQVKLAGRVLDRDGRVESVVPVGGFG